MIAASRSLGVVRLGIGILALALTGCASEPPEDTAAVNQELSAVAKRTLGFESLADWSPLFPTTKLALEAQHTQGEQSLALRGGGWMQVVSRKLDDTERLPAVVGFDIKAPDVPVDGAWSGSVGLLMEAPRSGVLPVFLGLHDVQALGRGFHRVQFAVPEWVQKRLAGGYKDLRLSIFVNAPLRERGAYLLDDFRLGPASVPGCLPQDDGNPCTEDICVGQQPVSTPRPPGSSCESGDDVCDGIATCDGAGSCRAGTPSELDDGNPCTVDVCDPKLGVSHLPTPTGTPCSDGNECTLNDVCSAGECQPGEAKECPPLDACHPAGECRPASGECSVPEALPGCGVGGNGGAGGDLGAGGSSNGPAGGGGIAGSSNSGGSGGSGGNPQPNPEESLPFETLPSDFEPPTVPPSAVLGSVQLIDPNGVLPASVSMSDAPDEDGAFIADEVAGVAVEPSGALTGVAYLKVALPAGAVGYGAPALWTKTANSSRYRLQSLGRVIAGHAYVPIRHFSLQRLALPPPPVSSGSPVPVPLPDQYGGVTPQHPEYSGPDYSWPWWSSGRAAASVSFKGVASLRSKLDDQSIVDPFPAGAGSRDGRVLVDDFAGLVRTPTGDVALDDVCDIGATLLQNSARVSADAASVSWVVLGLDDTLRLCRMQLDNHSLEQCELPQTASDARLAAHPGAALSEDGTALSLETTAALVAGDANGAPDVYVAKLAAGQPACAVELAARDEAGAAFALGSSLDAATRTLSAHGRFVGFSAIVPTADYDERVLFVRDLLRGETRRAGRLIYGDPAASSWNAWSLSDSGRSLAFRSTPLPEDLSYLYEPNYSIREKGLLLNVVDGVLGDVWPHELFYRANGTDCGPLGMRAYFPYQGQIFCESLSGPNALSLSGDGRWVVFVAHDGRHSFRASDFPDAERYLMQRTPSVVGPAPPMTFPVGVHEMTPFEIVVGQVGRATPRLLRLAGPDDDYYEAELHYGSDGLARVPFPQGVAGGDWSASVLVEADGDLLSVEARPAGGFAIGKTIPSVAHRPDPVEFVETPLTLGNLPHFEPSDRVVLLQSSTVLGTFDLARQTETSIVLPRLAEGEYELRVYARVLGKDRLRVTLPFSVGLAFELVGNGSSPSLSDDGRFVAYCNSKLNIHERPTRQTRVYDQPCRAARITPDGSRALVLDTPDSKNLEFKLLDTATGATLFQFEHYFQYGSGLTPRFGNWPFSSDERFFTFEVREYDALLQATREHVYLLDVVAGTRAYLSGLNPNLNGAGTELTYEHSYGDTCDDNGNCNIYNPRPIRLPMTFIAANCTGESGCFWGYPLPFIPERVCPYPAEQCYVNPALPLPETPEPIGSAAFHPDDITVVAATRDADLLYYQFTASWEGAWRSWKNNSASHYASVPKPLGTTQLTNLSGALLGRTAWLSAKHFEQPSIVRFEEPGAGGVPLVTLPVDSSNSPTGAPSHVQVTPDRRLLTFSSYRNGILDAAGRAPLLVPVPPPVGVATGVYVIGASPAP